MEVAMDIVEMFSGGMEVELERESTEKTKKGTSVLYAVFLHDGDEEPVVKPVPNHSIDVTSHYYAIYAIPLPVGDSDSDATSGLPEKKLKPSPSSLPLHPVATLSLRDFPHTMTFACIGSDIYAFGGWNSSWRCSDPRQESPSLKTYIIDTTRLPDPDPTNPKPLVLTPNTPDDVIKSGPSLNTLKDWPYSVSHLGKIFAIPNAWQVRSRDCVEFLDPPSSKWQRIDNPPFDPSESTMLDVCTVFGSRILLESYSGFVYELDAEFPLQGWTKQENTFEFWEYVFSTASTLDKLLLANHECDPSVSRPSEPIGPEMGGEITRKRKRKVLAIGDGLAAIVTCGFTQTRSLELRLVLDIVRPVASGSDQVEIVPLKSSEYVIGKVNSKYFNLCGIFPVNTMGSRDTQSSAVASYFDVVVDCRRNKFGKPNVRTWEMHALKLKEKWEMLALKLKEKRKMLS